MFFCIFILLILSSSFSLISSQNEVENQQNSFYQDSINVRTHTTIIDIYEPNIIIVQESFVIENTGLNNISYVDMWFNSSLSTLLVEDGEGSLLYNWNVISNTSNSVRINFRTELEQNETVSFLVKYDLNTILMPLGSNPIYYSFEFYTKVYCI